MAITRPLDPVLSARSALANAHKRNADPARIAEARRTLTLTKLERAIQEALAATPSLTTQNRAELAGLLLGGEPA